MVLIFILGVLVAYILYRSFKKPGIVIVLIISMFAIEQLLQANYGAFLSHGYLFNVLVGALVLVLTVKLVLRYGLITLTITREEFLVYILYFYAFVSVFWSADTAGSLQRWSNQLPYIILFLFLAPRLVTSLSSVTDMVAMQVIVGGILSILLLTMVEWSGRKILIDDFYGNPLAVADMAGYTALCAALFKASNKHEIGMLLLRVIVIGLCLIVIVKSGSRGQLFAVIASLIVCWPLSYKINNIAGFVSIVVLSSALLYFTATILEEFQGGSTRFEIDKMSDDMGGRFHMASTMVSHAMSNPISILFGLGNGSSYAIVGFYPHMVPLEILSEEGLIGFTIYSFILLYAAKNIIKLNKLFKKSNDQHKRAGVVLVALILLLFILSLKQGSMLGSVMFFMMTIMLGKYIRMIESSVNHAHRSRHLEKAVLSR